MAAALDADQEPEADEPVGWQPVWKRPRTPKSKAAKKRELHKQRRRLQDAAKRRLAAGNSRRPRVLRGFLAKRAAVSASEDGSRAGDPRVQRCAFWTPPTSVIDIDLVTVIVTCHRHSYPPDTRYSV